MPRLNLKTALISIATAILLAGMILFLWFPKGDNRISEAEKSYYSGESATTIASRKKEFNRALDLFLQLEEEYRPEFGNGRLYFNIGNTYFQLEEYPWAILYYQRAQNLMPREEKVRRNLALAREKLALSQPSPKGLLDAWFAHPYFSLPERLQAFLIVGVIAFVCCSGWVWGTGRWWQRASFLALAILALLAIYLGVVYYLVPVEAVLVRPVELRRDAGVAFAKVGDQPVPAGTMVEVLGTSLDGSWLKISVPDGSFGYAPSEALRLIQ